MQATGTARTTQRAIAGGRTSRRRDRNTATDPPPPRSSVSWTPTRDPRAPRERDDTDTPPAGGSESPSSASRTARDRRAGRASTRPARRTPDRAADRPADRDDDARRRPTLPCAGAAARAPSARRERGPTGRRAGGPGGRAHTTPASRADGRRPRGRR